MKTKLVLVFFLIFSLAACSSNKEKIKLTPEQKQEIVKKKQEKRAEKKARKQELREIKKNRFTKIESNGRYESLLDNVQASKYNPKIHTRIRMYGLNGNYDNIQLVANKTCSDSFKLKRGFYNGLPRKLKNYSIGIPQTEKSQSSDEKWVTYKEFIYKGDTPYFLNVWLGGAAMSSRTIHSGKFSVILEAGKDYEMYLDIKQGRVSLVINEVQNNNNNRLATVINKEFKACRF